jgi:hypothetical protein
MVSFVTLLLGVVVGVVQVNLMAGAEVAAIELQLDGSRVAVVEGPPWKFSCDFGPDPMPRELVAIARDAAGRELGRATQWVNVPRPEAELEVVMVSGGQRPVMRLAWESVGNRSPSSVRATLDGITLDASDPAAIPLPRIDLDQIHFFRAEATFPEIGTISRELVFGGRFVEQTETALTALPVLVEEGETIDLASIRIQRGGAPVAVVAIEKAQADLVVIVDPSALRLMPGMSTAPGTSPRMPAALDGLLTPRGSGQHIRVLSPIAHHEPEESSALLNYRLFPSTGPDSPRQAGGLLWYLARARMPATGTVRLSDAVAVAGLMAAERGRRRAVLVISGGSDQAATYTPAAVRSYLSALRVPLFVWSVAQPSSLFSNEWSEVEVVSNRKQLQSAWSRVQRSLEGQQVVWLEGRHLPQSLEVVAGPARVAGTD